VPRSALNYNGPDMFDNVRRVSRQLAAYGTADVAVLGVNFLLLPVYTRVLSTREYGAFALLLVCEAFLKPVFRWGLDHSYLRFYYDYHTDHDRQTLAGTIVLFLAAVNGALLAMLLATGAVVNGWLLGTGEFLPAYQLLVINGFVGTFLFLPLSLLRIQERSALYASLTFVRSFGTVVARLALVVALRMGVFGLVLADTVIAAVLLVALSGTFRAMVRIRFSRTMLVALLRYGLPRVPHGLFGQAMAMSDRFFLSMYLPLRDVGVYLIGNSIAAVVKFFPAAFGTAWMPFAFDSMRRADAPRLYARLATYAFAVLVIVALAIAGLARHVVTLMVPPEFQDAATVVPLLTLGMAIQSLMGFLATSLNISKQTRPFPLIVAAGAVASVAGSVLLIPRYGMIGAAIATVGGQTTATLAAIYFAQRAYPIPYETWRLAKLVIVTTAAYIVMELMGGEASWPNLAMRLGVIALVPVALFAVRFFEPHELAEFRQAAAALAERRRRTMPDPGQAATPERTK